MFADFHLTEVLAVDLSANIISIATRCSVLNWCMAAAAVMAIDSAHWKSVSLSVFNVPKSLHLAM